MFDSRFPPSSLNNAGLDSLTVGRGLHEVSFSARAGLQEGIKDQPLAKSEAKIQLIQSGQDSRHSVLNVCAFSVAAYLPKSHRFLTVQHSHKELPDIDNLTAGIVAPSGFWQEASLRNPPETMKQLWQSACQTLASEVMAIAKQARMRDATAIEKWVREELQGRLQQFSDMVLAETSKEIKLRLARENAA